MGRKSSGNYIKLNRSILKWRWWGTHNTTIVFIYCLLSAHWNSDDTYRDHIIPRGSLVRTLEEIAKDTNLTIQNVRTALKNLKKTQELTFIRVYRSLMITVVKYEEYQTGNIDLTFNQHLSNIYNGSLPIKEKRKEEGREEENTLPTLDDVKNFAVEINSKTNPEKFYYHYVAHGWPKNWMAKFQEWTAKDGKNEQQEDGESEKWEG